VCVYECVYECVCECVCKIQKAIKARNTDTSWLEIRTPLGLEMICNPAEHNRVICRVVQNHIYTVYTVQTIYHAAKILFLGGAASSHPLKYINS
jgi:hypothetical protein